MKEKGTFCLSGQNGSFPVTLVHLLVTFRGGLDGPTEQGIGESSVTTRKVRQTAVEGGGKRQARGMIN